MCEALGISRSGFYAWLTRPKSKRDQLDEVMSPQVYRSFIASDRTYGARRILRDILELGQRCGPYKIERLMKAQALRTRPRRRAKQIDRGECLPGAIGSNLLDRQFVADAPNKKWVADFT
jgi:putative transposase